MAEDASYYVVAVIENRAKEVGLAAFDMRTAKLHLSQFIETSRSYQNTATLLQFFDPSNIILPANCIIRQGTIGLPSIVNQFASATKVTLARGCFDDTKGALLVQNLVSDKASQTTLEASYKQYYLSLGAAAALLRWVDHEKGVVLANHSLEVTLNRSFDHMNIDGTRSLSQCFEEHVDLITTSVQNLELVETLSLQSRPKKNRGCLFEMLNTTKTVGGTRLLRANLLQPLKDMYTINTRLDCLDELTSDENVFFGLSQALQKFPKDIDRVLCYFCFKNIINANSSTKATTRAGQSMVRSIILLKGALDHLPNLREVLEGAKCSLLKNIRDICNYSSFSLLLKRIQEVINEDVIHSRALFVSRTQQCFAVKTGIDGYLDIAREVFCSTSEAIHELAKTYREELSLPNLKMPFNSNRGFYITFPGKDLQGAPVPQIFNQVVRKEKTICCSTAELTSMNSRNMEAAAECYKRTSMCLEELTSRIREDLHLLTSLAESLSLLDMMVNSFANLVSTKAAESYIRPEFTETGPIAIEAGRHPVLEGTISEDFVANNTFLSEASNTMVVTGPNMSGKSTYLRQVVLITIMAHIGCYVPARFASFRIVDHIFTRIGTSDNIELNSSTFMTEMRETAYLLTNLTPRSLVVVDELGRATSTCDGLAIAWSCCEYLLSFRAYTLFATHMQRLTELSSVYPNVRVCYFDVGVLNNRLNFKFLLREGSTRITHYGIRLAELAGLPHSVIDHAREIAAKVDGKEKENLAIGQAKYGHLRKDYHVAQKLLCLQYANLSEENLRGYLKNLQESYLDDKLG